MDIINISKEELLDYLTSTNKSLYRGYYGIIYQNNDKLEKIYYKDFTKTFVYKDPIELDQEVLLWLDIEKDVNKGLRNPYKKLEDYKRLLDTKSNNLITNVLSYKGLFVGVEMNYYKDYISLDDALYKISEKELKEYLKKYEELLYDLLKHNIVSKDIKSNNALVNLDTNDLVLIDLDDPLTTYGPIGYLDEYENNKEIVDEGIYKLENELIIRQRKRKK